VQQVPKARLALQEFKAHKESKVLQVQLALQVLKVLQELLVYRVHKVLREPMAQTAKTPW
jgi:hypothetical protein